MSLIAFLSAVSKRRGTLAKAIAETLANHVCPSSRFSFGSCADNARPNTNFSVSEYDVLFVSTQ
jgi:hypothetical protein